jgi:hypothetical protein
MPIAGEARRRAKPQAASIPPRTVRLRLGVGRGKPRRCRRRSRANRLPRSSPSRAAPDAGRQTPDLVIAANAVIEALYKLKVDTVPLPDPATGATFPSLSRIYIQTHLLRLLMFLEGGVHEHEQQRPLFAISAARSMYERIASFHDFSTQLCQKLDKCEFNEAAELLLGRAFATRLPEHIDPDESNKVVNVVTQVHRLSKSVAGFEDTYNRMSEFVHPNAYGSGAK